MSLCDFEDRVSVYIGYGNTISIVPIANTKTGEIIDMTAATHVNVCIGTAVASSTDVPSYIWWDEVDDEWQIHFKPGMFSGLPTGEQNATIVVFSNTYPNGLVITSDFPLTIQGVC